MSSIRNGGYVEILENNGSWYKVSAAGIIGYLHHTWLKIDQYVSGPFDARYIQIKSFSNYSEMRNFIKNSNMKLEDYLSTNGWYSITVAGNYNESRAGQLLATLNAAGRVPSNSYYTYGNTYMLKVCCD